MSADGVLMYVSDEKSGNALYRHRVKGSQQAYVFCGPKDAGEYAERNNLLAVHKTTAPTGDNKE